MWEDVNLNDGYCVLTETKNGHGRMVALTKRARVLFELLMEKSEGNQRIFSSKPESYSQLFKRACGRLAIVDLHLHDLRREGVSRFVEMGLNQFEVQSISGHKTLSMLNVYTKLNVKTLVKKMG